MRLARLRLREAEALYDAKLYDGCVYLAGYVVEMALKARICRFLHVLDYPENLTSGDPIWGTEMDIKTLVAEIEAFVEKSQREKGPYWLVMLVGNGDVSPASKWNLVVSAPWIDSVRRRAALLEIIHGLKSALSFESQTQIERVSIVRTHDPFVRAVARDISVDGMRHAVLQNRNIYGYEIPYGIVIVADVPQEMTTAKKEIEQPLAGT